MRPVWLGLSLAASSLGNVIPILGAASTGDATVVGTIGVLTAAYIVSLCVVRGLIGEPLLLQGTAGPASDAEAAGVTLGAGLTGAVLVPITLFVVDQAWYPVAVVSATLPALLLQDTLRYVAIARAVPHHAATSDWVWVAVTAILTTGLISTGWQGAAPLVGAWAAGGLAGVVYLLLALRVAPTRHGALGYLRSGWALRLHLATDALLTTGSLQVSLVIAAAVAGLAGMGLVRLLQTLFGPVTLLFSVLYVEFVARHRIDRAGLTPAGAAVRMAAILTLVTLVVAGAIALLPLVVRSNVGTVVAQSSALLVPFAASQVAAALGTSAVTGLRLADRAGVAAAIRAFWAGALVAGTAAGGLLFGTSGYVWTWAAIHLLAATAWWHQLLRAPMPRTSPSSSHYNHE